MWYSINMKNVMQNNWIKAIIVNLIILVLVMLITNPAYETNDDFAISSRIAAGYPYVGFINYFACKILIPIQQMFPSVNIFVVSQIVFSFVAFVFVLKLFMDSAKNKVSVLAIAFAIMLFAFDHYCTIQFTKTAALILVTAMLVLIDSMLNKRSTAYYVYSMLLLFIGVTFRPDSLICAIGFAGIYLVVWVVTNRKQLIPEGYLSAKKIAIYVMLLALIGASYGYFQISEKINESTPALKAYSDYSELRSDVVDYPIYDYYEENRDAYEKIGISENDLYMLDHWYLDYDGAASSKNLTAILAVDSNSQKEAYTVSMAFKDFAKETLGDIHNLSFTGIHVVMLSVIALWLIIALKPKHWIYVLLLGGFVICLYVAVYYMQRPVYRALYIGDIGGVIWLLYYLNNNLGGSKRGRSTGIIAIIIMLVLAIPVCDGCQGLEKSASRHVMAPEMSKYITNNHDKYYVFSASEKKFPETYLDPLKSPGKDSEKNVIGAGSWGTGSPYVLNKMGVYGIRNPIRDLIDNENAFYVGNANIDRLNEYYNKWYGDKDSRIVLKQIDDVAGKAIWKVNKVDF